jgi:regulator of protease activity HflC (stomatin/prohibitin superfamily)
MNTYRLKTRCREKYFPVKYSKNIVTITKRHREDAVLGIEYFKAEPTEYARIRVGKKIKKEGAGISGYYLPFRTTIEMVSIATGDQPFVFTEFSTDNQEVNIQGGFIYKALDPRRVMEEYNFSIDPQSKTFLADGFQKLPEHILQLIKGKTRNIVQGASLQDILVMGDSLAEILMELLAPDDLQASMGVELRNIYITSIRPTPEIAKALEAQYREQLLQKADEAIYTRRAQAVENERVIQQNELKTKIELEQKREELVALEGKNILQQADFRARAKERELKAFEQVGADMVTAQALLALGENAQKIETLTITPELLAGILKK